MSTVATAPITKKVPGHSVTRRMQREDALGLLGLLETVERGMRLGDALPDIARNVVRNEQYQDKFIKLVRIFAGFERRSQEQFVEELLVDYFVRAKIVREANPA